MPIHLAVVGDLHVNSAAGLLPRRVVGDDGNEIRANSIQRQLDEYWGDFWERFASLDGYRVAVINGEAADIDSKQRSAQMLTRNKERAAAWACEVLELPAAAADLMVFTRGTAAHSGDSAWMDEALAANFDHAARNGDDRAAWWSWYAQVEQCYLLIQHHGPAPGRRPWTYLSPLLSYAYGLSIAPRKISISIANHNHIHADTQDAYPVRHVANGCWQHMTEYSYRLATLARPSIGGLIVTVDGARVGVEWIGYEVREERCYRVGGYANDD